MPQPVYVGVTPNGSGERLGEAEGGRSMWSTHAPGDPPGPTTRPDCWMSNRSSPGPQPSPASAARPGTCRPDAPGRTPADDDPRRPRGVQSARSAHLGTHPGHRGRSGAHHTHGHRRVSEQDLELPRSTQQPGSSSVTWVAVSPRPRRAGPWAGRHHPDSTTGQAVAGARSTPRDHLTPRLNQRHMSVRTLALTPPRIEVNASQHVERTRACLSNLGKPQVRAPLQQAPKSPRTPHGPSSERCWSGRVSETPRSEPVSRLTVPRAGSQSVKRAS